MKRNFVLPSASNRIKSGSLWALAQMQYALPLSKVAAINEVDNACSILRDHPELFRQKVKYYIGNTIRTTERHEELIRQFVQDASTMEELYENIVEVQEEDVKKLRTLVLEDLKSHNVPNADIIAWVEVARILLSLSVYHFKSTMQRGIGKFAYDYTKTFRSFCVTDTLTAWTKVASSLNPTTLQAPKPVIDQIVLIRSKYADATYLSACIQRMKDHPYFASITPSLFSPSSNS